MSEEKLSQTAIIAHDENLQKTAGGTVLMRTPFISSIIHVLMAFPSSHHSLLLLAVTTFAWSPPQTTELQRATTLLPSIRVYNLHCCQRLLV